MLSIADITSAQRRIAGKVRRTPCVDSPILSELTGVRLALKLETCSSPAITEVCDALERAGYRFERMSLHLAEK